MMLQSVVVFERVRFEAETFGFLAGEGEESGCSESFADVLGRQSSALTDVGCDTGRNVALRDPESAYRMMTQINRFAVDFKAQYAELSAMGEAVEQLENAGNTLAALDDDSTKTDIRTQLQAFVDHYNAWVDRFMGTIADGGVLDNVQAAEVSLYELEQSVRNRFNGAAEGVDGMEALGISIDPVSKRASLDSARLESMLDSNKHGAVSAIDAFSENFARSADLLNSDGNFIPNQLDNRARAIRFIADNLSSWQQEFGFGDTAQPSSAVAQALSAYERMSVLV